MNIALLRKIRLVAFVLIFTLAGFYANVWYQSQNKPSAATGVAVPDAADAVTQLPEFSLADLNGELHSIQAFTGGPLLINFWATWCGPCLREMPLLESVWQERNDAGLQIVGVAVDRQAEVETYLETTPVSYPILIGQSDGMTAAESFGPAFVGLPFTVFVAPGGEILLTYSGELEREQLMAYLSVINSISSGKLSVEEARDRLQP